jgi:hypothetical protein
MSDSKLRHIAYGVRYVKWPKGFGYPLHTRAALMRALVREGVDPGTVIFRWFRGEDDPTGNCVIRATGRIR